MPPEVLLVLLAPNPPKVEVPALGVVLNNEPPEVVPVPNADLLAPKAVAFEPGVPNVEPDSDILISHDPMSPVLKRFEPFQSIHLEKMSKRETYGQV